MSANVTTQTLEALVALLGEEATLHEQLGDALESCREAVRSADVAAISSATLRQKGLVQQVRRCEGVRRPLMDRLGRELGLAGRTGRSMALSQLAARLNPAAQERVTAVGVQLKRAVDRVARLNRVNERIAARLVDGVGLVLSAVRPRQAERLDYAGDGRTVERMDTVLLDAVG
jgi:hypothetical protein